jgi:hypothetical protein
MERPKTRNIGPDRVALLDDRLLVVSRADMAGWDVRRHRSSLIRFEARTWRVMSKTAGANNTIQYALVPWHPANQEITGPEIDYNADYVALRDHALDLGRRNGLVVLLLRFLAPLAGFLPARIKARLESAYGLDPVSATFQSVLIELFIVLPALVLSFMAFLLWRWAVGSLTVIAVVAAIDGVVRWDRVLGEERPPPGFYEWLIRRRP